MIIIIKNIKICIKIIKKFESPFYTRINNEVTYKINFRIFEWKHVIKIVSC